MRYWATIEYLKGQNAAIVALFDSKGEWSGAGRIECRAGKPALYEAGYILASRSAAAKGGTLDRYSEVSK